MSEARLPPVEFVTDEPLIHKPTCLTRRPVLTYSSGSGRITCAHCGASVPGEVRQPTTSAKFTDFPPKEEP
jgi:LSD1 subclass zinc finger protein